VVGATTITQVVMTLLAGKTYRLKWSGRVSSNKTIAAMTTLVCPA